MDESMRAITILGVSLGDAVQQGNIDALYSLIRSDAKVLHRIDKIPFVETPLHTAASAGQIQFAMEIMRLKPSFARKLNEDGYTPVHVALQNNQPEVALCLVDVDEDLVRVKGKEGLTPLHFITQIGNLDVLVKFLKACPKSIEDVTNGGETVLHIALKNNMFNVVRVLLGWLQRTWFKTASQWENTLLNQKDDDGNTVLHIAVSKNKTKIVKLLLRFRWFFWRYTIDINAKNSGGFTALGMLRGDNQKIKGMLRRARYFSYCCSSSESDADYFKSPVNIEEKLYIIFLRLSTEISNDLRNVLLVVAALLVTISFQAVIAPPGGVWQETKYRDETHNYNSPNNNATEPPPAGAIISHYAGTAVMRNTDFPILAGLNVTSFFVTVFTIFLLLPAGFGARMFCLPLYTLSLCFIASICIISPNTNDISPGLSWIWKNFILFCVFSPMLFQYLVYIVTRRRNRLVDAFLLKGKAPDPTLM